MAKQTKNIITREEIKSKLVSENGRDLIFHSILGIAIFLLFLPINFFILNAIWNMNNGVWIKILFTLLDFVALNVPFILDVIAVVYLLTEKKKIKQDEFEITVLSLIYKEDTVARRFNFKRLVKRGPITKSSGTAQRLSKRLHFANFDAEDVSDTIYDLASNGDDFYIVYFKGENYVEQIYPAKMYELK